MAVEQGHTSANVRNILGRHGPVINSVHPCTSYLTFGPWIYLVPQFEPESVLMLGYAGGTTAGLIRLLYGDVPITAVDIDFMEDPYGVEQIQMDARDFLREDDRRFDALIVDIFPPETPSRSYSFVLGEEFMEQVTARCNYLILHATEGDDVSSYEHLHHVRTLGINNSRFHYFMVNRVARLPVR